MRHLALQIARYLPSAILPAAFQFLGIAVYTYFLTPAQYGRYALLMSAATLVDAALIRWVRDGQMRFFPSATVAGTLPDLLGTLYRMSLCVGVGFILLGGIGLRLAAPADLFWGGVLSLLYAFLFALQQQNLVVHRSSNNPIGFTISELGRSGGTFILALLAIRLIAPSQLSIMGASCAALLMVIGIDIPIILKALRGPGWDRAVLRRIVAFTAPGSVTQLLAEMAFAADRFVIAYFVSTAGLGLYAVGVNLTKSTSELILGALMLGAYPLLLKAYEQDGPEVAKLRLRDNISLVSFLILPAMIGLAALSHQIVKVCFGPQFAGAGLVIPLLAFAMLLRGMKTHLFDHVFHILKRNDLLLYIILPMLAASATFNLVFTPRFGILGAGLSAVLNYAIGLAASIYIGQRMFKVPIPWGEMLRILLASLGMGATLFILRFPATPSGLVGGVATGALEYALLVMALDILGFRTLAMRIWRERRFGLIRFARRV